MKKTLLFSLLAVFFTFHSVHADVVCYSEEEINTPDFFLDNIFYATCTDWVGTGSKLFAENNDYVDFNPGTTVEFPVKVSKDGDYTLVLYYSIGYAGESGAMTDLDVNDQKQQIVLFNLTEDPPAVKEINIELYADYDNTIQFRQNRDWPIFYGIQLISNIQQGVTNTKDVSYKIKSTGNIISIDQLEGNNDICIYSIDGRLINSSIVSDTSFSTSTINKGVYIIKVNNNTHKVVIK